MDDIKKYEPLFGSWTIDRVIGEGSFGKVYALKKTDFGKDYFSALKVISVPQNASEISSLRSEGMDDQSIKNHFKLFVAEVVSEFDLMARFRGNSNIVSYEDHLLIPSEDGYGYNILIRMELLTSLVSVLEKNEFSKKDVIQLGIDMCKALELCQKHDIIHRDIKPENIFVSNNGDYKLGDFGIARTVEKTGGEMSKKGTYTYMAPEVYKSEPYGSDVDIYSLGIVLYRLLNGNRTPFLPQHPAPITHSDRENAILRRISGARIPPPTGAGGRLAEIVMKSIEYNPKDRFISPYQMRKELETISYNESEGQIIYPMGDRIELPKNQYASGSVMSQPPQRQQPPPQQSPPPATAGYTANLFEPSANKNAYPQQPVSGGSAGYAPARAPSQQAPKPPVYAPTGVPNSPTPPAYAPPVTQSAPPPQNPPGNFDATVADVSGRGQAYTPPNAYPPASTSQQASGKPPWLKWAIIAGAALIVIVVGIIILTSTSKKTTDDDPTISSSITPTEPTPSEPTPTDSTPTEPTPTDSTPTEPTPTEPTPTEPTPTEPTPTEPTPTEPTPSEIDIDIDLDEISIKLWTDLGDGTYNELKVNTIYEVQPGVSIFLSEIGFVVSEDGITYVGAGVVVTNDMEYSTIYIEDRDFVCVSLYDNYYDDLEFKTSDYVLDINNELTKYPVYVESDEGKYMTLLYEVPDNTEYAVFAYTNIWGDDFSGEPYIYIVTEYLD